MTERSNVRGCKPRGFTPTGVRIPPGPHLRSLWSFGVRSTLNTIKRRCALRSSESEGGCMDMHYVYILKSSKDNTRYIGTTQDLKRRIQEHNSAGSKFTTPKRPYKLIWYCAFPNKHSAYAFEHYLKSGSGQALLQKRLIYI